MSLLRNCVNHRLKHNFQFYTFLLTISPSAFRTILFSYGTVPTVTEVYQSIQLGTVHGTMYIVQCTLYNVHTLQYIPLHLYISSCPLPLYIIISTTPLHTIMPITPLYVHTIISTTPLNTTMPTNSLHTIMPTTLYSCPLTLCIPSCPLPSG